MINTAEFKAIHSEIVRADELVQRYLSDLGVGRVDKLIEEYREEVSLLPRNATLSNERVRYYIHHMGIEHYKLSTTLAKANLQKDVSSAYLGAKVSEKLLDVRNRDGKFIREEKEAIATSETYNETIISKVFSDIQGAIVERLNSVNKILYGLGTIATLNMADMKQTGTGSSI